MNYVSIAAWTPEFSFSNQHVAEQVPFEASNFMRAKSVLLLVIALGCGVVASVAVSQVVLDQKNRGTVVSVPVLVVVKEISAATKIPQDSVRVEQWPMDRVPQGALSDPKMIENKFTKQRIYPGEPIIEAKLSGKGRDFTVPAGYQIFDIAVKDETGGGGYIGPGDHVDIYGYFDKSARVKAAKSVKVMENLEVVMIDGVAIADPDAAKQKKSTTIQMLVKDSQYIVLDTAANLGKLRLALRPPAQVAAKGSEIDDGEQFLSWLKDSDTKSEEKLIADSPALPQSNTEKPDKHDILIITPSKSTLYRFLQGQSNPQKVDMDQPTPESPPLGGYQSQNNPINNRTSQSANSSSASQPTWTKAPVNPASSAQPTSTWDPNSSNWQSGGFKATYPGEK
jgi:pilus assembly protein CpaB